MEDRWSNWLSRREHEAERNLADNKISRKELHVIVSAMWQLYTEPIVHGMSDKEIEHHCKVVGDLFNWAKAVGIKK